MDGCHDRVVFTCWTIDFQGLTDRQTLRVFNVFVFWVLFSAPVTRTVAVFREIHVTCARWNIVTEHRIDCMSQSHA